MLHNQNSHCKQPNNITGLIWVHDPEKRIHVPVCLLPLSHVNSIVFLKYHILLASKAISMVHDGSVLKLHSDILCVKSAKCLDLGALCIDLVKSHKTTNKQRYTEAELQGREQLIL